MLRRVASTALGSAFVLSAWLLLATLEVRAAAPVQPVDPMLLDAQLNDVVFVDQGLGWAVGDRGAIWHTNNGGREWKLQLSGVDCRLSSVYFLDAQNGWAAGGTTQPYTQTTSGVLLRTADGGKSWKLERKLMLPAIERIGFFDPATGWALGRSSAYFPSGAFTTTDGGRTWSPLASSESRGWLAGDMIDAQNGALAGRAGAVAAVRRRDIEPVSADFGLRALARMKLVAPAAGWMVGDGGLVLATHDLGKSWQTPERDSPPPARNQFDFAALAARGAKLWVAGTPGTRVWHSSDSGATWSAGDTQQTLPIRALAFVDDQTGYAVGDMGTILATLDGGRTWQRQRGGGSRAAYLGLYSSAAEVPLELVARLSADEGYLAAFEILNRQDIETRSDTDAPALAHEASVRSGASAAGTAWRFPLRDASLRLSAEQIVDVWNTANDGQAVNKLEAYVVGRVRMWRPSVVFTAAADPRGGNPLAHVVNQVVLRAVERAADPARYPEQLAIGLQPWKVEKVYATLADGESGTTSVNTSQVAARLGRSISEVAAPARGLLAGEFAPPRATLGFRLLVDHIPQEVGQRDFFSGIAIAPGSEARRPFDPVTTNNAQAMRREVQLRRNLQAILTQAENEQRDGRFLADFSQQTRQLEPARAAEVLFQLADHYHRKGRWELAAECFDLIVERYPTHPLAGKSLVWLVQYHSSTEAAWRNRADQQHTLAVVSAQAPPRRLGKPDAPLAADNEGVQPAGGFERRPEISAGAQVARAGGVVVGEAATAERLAKAAGYAKQLEQLQPALAGEPMVRFPLAVAHRLQGMARQSDRFYLALRNARSGDAWQACAAAELWLADRKGQPPKELALCSPTPGKPKLDGQLDEPLWRAASRLELHSPLHDDTDWGAVAMLAYDEEFLYLAVSCTHAPGVEYVRSEEPRPRDADLSNNDRVELLVDLDHDFATYYRLAIDSRGWTSESCWRDATWNPNWYVAAADSEGSWTVEAAIPLAELTGQLPHSKNSWAIGLQRVVPGVGFQAWTAPASPQVVPEGFGLLIFQ